MAQRKTKPEKDVAGGASLSAGQAMMLLNEQINRGKQILGNPNNIATSFSVWESITEDVLVQIFGPKSPNVDLVMKVGREREPLGVVAVDNNRLLMEIIYTRLELMGGLLDHLNSIHYLGMDEASDAEAETKSNAEYSNRVFLVHGRNEAAIHETARFLEKLNLEPIILREQPNSGRTIIEKFVDYSDVAFSIVLLTGDDRGGLAADTYENQKHRARQNVILELGYFLGKLGRNRVCALYQDDVDIPSDYNGVLFIPIDKNGAWRLALARELKAAGLDIDLNDAM